MVPLVLGLASPGVERDHLAQICACAESDVTGAGDDDRAHAIVGRELGPRVGESAERLGVECVALFGAIDAHDRDVAIAFDHDR